MRFFAESLQFFCIFLSFPTKISAPAFLPNILLPMKSLPFRFFLLFFLSRLAACGGGIGKLDSLQAGDTSGVEKAREVEMLYSDSGTVRARIVAPTLLYKLDPKNPQREFPDGMRAFFFDENAQPSSYLSARHAVHSERDKAVTLRDSVVVWNERRERLETQELVWNETEKTIHSTKFVRITTPSEIITGFGFRADMDFKNWEIDSVSGRVRNLGGGGF